VIRKECEAVVPDAAGDYTIIIDPRAEKRFLRLPRFVQRQIAEKQERLRTDPRGKPAKKLKARDDWSLRSGDYRIIYEVDDAIRTVTILDFGDRKDVYR
jgi:mRNA interferase RelE/StbE